MPVPVEGRSGRGPPVLAIIVGRPPPDDAGAAALLFAPLGGEPAEPEAPEDAPFEGVVVVVHATLSTRGRNAA